MESLVTASLHQIRLCPCVKGSCLFLSSFSFSRGQRSRPRIVPRSPLSHVIYRYYTTDRYSKSRGCVVDIGIQGCSLSAKRQIRLDPNRSKPSKTIRRGIQKKKMYVEVLIQKKAAKLCVIVRNITETKIQYWQKTVWHDRC